MTRDDDAAMPDAPAPSRPVSGDTRTNDLNPVAPDAVSPQVRQDGDGPVRGGMTRETGAGAAGGRDPSGPGGREPERTPGETGNAGRGTHST